MTKPGHRYLYICSESDMEAGSNASTIAIRVTGGDEKESLESVAVKYGNESHGAWT
jgi:hypothetical protein